MARYYCEYCHSYLTHDTLSVRKFHLMGKNHIKIRADYYRSKLHAEQRHKTRQKSHKSRGTPTTTPTPTPTQHNEKLGSVKLLTRKEKRRNRKLARTQRKELEKPIDVLSSVYAGSPGYNRVFVDSNRLDIGDSIKTSKLPQRANLTQKRQYKDRYETYEYYNTGTTTLPPPQQLTQWRTNYTQLYNQKIEKK